jgi:hypothetical protein
MDVARWLAHAVADAEARGLPQLKPLLETLAKSTAALRAAEHADQAEQAAPDSADHADDEE